MATMTVGEFRKAAAGGVVTNDRGNGCGGAGYIAEHDEDTGSNDDIVSTVTEDEDPEAWQLAREACKDLDLPDALEVVAVRHGDNGYEEIYGG